MASISLYIPGSSLIHRCDARVKLLLLLACSIAVFLVNTWAGMGVFVCCVLGCIAVARLPLSSIVKYSIPLVVLLLFIWLCNSLSFGSSALQQPKSWCSFVWEVSFANASFVMSFESNVTALFYAVRILVIFFAGYVVVFTSLPEELTGALRSFLSPLRSIRVPVDDIALVLSLALRFIPLMAVELDEVKRAQCSRGAQFDTGSAWQRVAAWRIVLIPLFVGMFRRAAVLGQAMEARCYGVGVPTHLQDTTVPKAQLVCLVFAIVLCAGIAVFF